TNELAALVNVTPRNMSRVIQKYAGRALSAQGGKQQLLKVLNYFDWAQRNPRLAVARYHQHRPQRSGAKPKIEKAKPSYEVLTERQKRIGQIMLQIQERRIKEQIFEAHKITPTFLKLVAEQLGVTYKPTLVNELKAAGGAQHLLEQARAHKDESLA